MIEIKGLSQSYQNKKVLENVSLVISENETCALVGRNGAGKTTLIHSLLGLLPVKQGEITLCGYSNKTEKWKKHVAYLPEKFQLYPQLTGDENFRFFASIDNPEVNEQRMEECLKMVNLWEHRLELIRGYSKGMLQRLGLGIMLYFDSQIMILDEPTSGLDPMGRTEILSILKSLQNKTILFSSHHMDEIRQVCTHVAFLENGEIKKYKTQEFLELLSLGGYE
ncbi:ABC transporter ATP-binding protein [Brevibacillus sp. SYSU BS000544]|uniref:ABC transporter ATP-binding protein n=1 Tax=Brevibacillus sp. SYSU BS000544 TaxID=3416443 RepID=UPI003CE49313